VLNFGIYQEQAERKGVRGIEKRKEVGGCAAECSTHGVTSANILYTVSRYLVHDRRTYPPIGYKFRLLPEVYNR
jgi:hypothetical protein